MCFLFFKDKMRLGYFASESRGPDQLNFLTLFYHKQLMEYTGF